MHEEKNVSAVSVKIRELALCEKTQPSYDLAKMFLQTAGEFGATVGEVIAACDLVKINISKDVNSCRVQMNCSK